jgi:hypothetical protein
VSFNDSTLYHLGANAKILSYLRFDSDIKHIIKLNESQFSVQTNISSNLVSLREHDLVLEESRIPDLQPNASQWLYLFIGDKQLFLDHTTSTLQIEYNTKLSDTSRVWSPLEYKDFIKNKTSKNFVFDIENQLLLYSIPGTQSYVFASFKNYGLTTSYIQNENSVPDACCANWFYDEFKKQVILFLRNGTQTNEYHAFAFEDGIPKPDKKVGQMYFHTKDWYQLGLYRGKFSSIPEYIEGDNLFKNEKKYGRLDLQAK